MTARRLIINILVILTVLLSGCGSMRPKEPPNALACNIHKYTKKDIYDDWRIYRSTLATKKSLEDKSPSFNVLSLSAGGEFGAYGAGFLVGWAKVGDKAIPSPRKDIQVVTGVSTGAILATHAFLGYDDEIEKIYRNLSGNKIYRTRSPINYLFSNSIFDTSAKDKLISDNLNSNIIDEVANQYEKGRFLYIGMVNIDTGEFVRVDMVKLAYDLQPKENRDLCYKAIIGASSAIPIAFSPKFIDGNMWADGGARRHLFITEPPKEAMGNVARRLYSFVHGDLSAGTEEVKNGVLQIARRTAELFIDQGMKDSIRLQDYLASKCPDHIDCGPSKQLFNTYYAAAANAAKLCKPKLEECNANISPTSDDMFCNAFMNCLADRGEGDGEEYASGTNKWLTFDNLCLGSSSGRDCTNKGEMKRQFPQ